jgi:hypothetical protein
MRKFSKHAFRAWLDVLAAFVVKERDKRTCQKCGKKMLPFDENCQWAHIKSRGENAWRWDILNAMTLCGTCHQWAHANPAQFGVWLHEHRPGIYSYIYEGRLRPSRTWKQWDYEEIERGLLEKCQDLKANPANMPVRWRAKLVKRLGA